MTDRRVWCATALLGFAACSFPQYEVPAAEGAPLTGCHDGIRDGNETGVDCGPSCDACPPCSDGMQNGDETGVDCGGRCGACPTCDDQLQNGSESDVDCGGTCAKRCATNQRCREAADCSSLVCSTQCQPSDCHDGVRNGRETSVDCGGDCMGCASGSACIVSGDCKDGQCQNGVCVTAVCTDGEIDGGETDQDCGGMQCAPCPPLKKCVLPRDCDSHVCAGGVCSQPTCSDSALNEGESAVDCGGASCTPCGTGKTCSMPSDCESTLCQNGTCVPKFPSGQPLSKAKWTLTSSEMSTETGLTASFDGDVATCWTSGKPQYAGMHVDIDLGEPQIFFKLLLQTTEAPYDQDFPSKLEVYVSTDGNFGDPSATNIQGSQWTWVDFPSAQVGRYVRIQLTQPGSRPWSIGEFNAYN